LIAQGYQVSRCHTTPKAFKTNAPHEAVWDVLRSWALLQPAKELDPRSAAARILAKPPA
jgi:hypothetical protein